MHDTTSCATRSLCEWLKLHSRHLTHSRSPHSHTRSPHSHALQELKDDLLDDTAWPVVMQWFNEDH